MLSREELLEVAKSVKQWTEVDSPRDREYVASVHGVKLRFLSSYGEGDDRLDHACRSTYLFAYIENESVGSVVEEGRGSLYNLFCSIDAPSEKVQQRKREQLIWADQRAHKRVVDEARRKLFGK